MPNFIQFEEDSGLVFNNKDLLKQAFTHRSYINEHRRAGLEHNERLEFLGDAVLELVITDYLYRQYTDKPEGDLTSYRSALVRTDTLSEIAEKINANNYLLLSKGEMKDTGRARQYILANTVEAIIGAIYLDTGYDTAKDFILKHFAPLAEDVTKDGKWSDAKSRFQEKAQDVEGVTPSYQTIKEEGPDHDKHFTVGVYLESDEVAQGQGKSKQDAEQNAAENALTAKGWQ